MRSLPVKNHVLLVAWLVVLPMVGQQTGQSQPRPEPVQHGKRREASATLGFLIKSWQSTELPVVTRNFWGHSAKLERELVKNAEALEISLSPSPIGKTAEINRSLSTDGEREAALSHIGEQWAQQARAILSNRKYGSRLFDVGAIVATALETLQAIAKTTPSCCSAP
jgi:hypothetical protein